MTAHLPPLTPEQLTRHLHRADAVARRAMAMGRHPFGALLLAPDGETVLAEIGEARSKRLVERCIQVSPATRPPCNSANPCAMIQGEIDRSCAMYGPDEVKPKECAA